MVRGGTRAREVGGRLLPNLGKAGKRLPIGIGRPPSGPSQSRLGGNRPSQLTQVRQENATLSGKAPPYLVWREKSAISGLGVKTPRYPGWA